MSHPPRTAPAPALGTECPKSIVDQIESKEAWADLRLGNLRYQKGESAVDSAAIVEKRRITATQGQKPFAAILACADSRLPAEIVFDQGLGDLFVVRVAGNVLAPSLIGSLELAAIAFDLPLIVVLGHEGCGAVRAACRMILKNEPPPSPHLEILLEEIQPSVIRELDRRKPKMKRATKDQFADPSAEVDTGFWSGVCSENVKHGIDGLLNRSEILRGRVDAGKLGIVGGVYDLASGEVRWLA